MIINNDDTIMDTVNSSLFPTLYPENILAVKITAGITCILSLFGASLIILTYVAFKDLRTIARQLLVNLCIADILVASSHFVGLIANFERFLPYYNHLSWNTSRQDPVCIIQGVISIYGTIASFLWSVVLPVYLLMLLVSLRRTFIVRMVPLFYIISWGLPVIIVVVNGALRFIGFEPIANPGWCYTTTTSFDCKENKSTGIKTSSIAGDLFSYEVWVDICLVVLPILYLCIFCYMRQKRQSDTQVQQLARVDIKLLFIPVIFLLLRIWVTISSSLLHYTDCDTSFKYKRSHVAAPAMTVLSGIGLNAQGIANAILFCIFTKQIRLRLLASIVTVYHVLRILCKCQYSKLSNRLPTTSMETETTTKFRSHDQTESCSVNTSYDTLLSKTV